jgi:hypothetical protein
MKFFEPLQGLWRLLLGIAAAYGVIHLLLTAVTYLGYAQGERMDTLMASRTVYDSATKYMLLNLDLLQGRRRRIIILGPSSAQVGFRPAHLESLLSGVDVHNVGLGNSTISTMSELLELFQQAAPRPDDIIVLGVWYGVFQEDALRFPSGRTDIGNEKLRYGFFSEQADGTLKQRLPTRYFPLMGDLLRPYLLFPGLLHGLGGAANPTAQEMDHSVISTQAQARERGQWRSFLKSDQKVRPQEQFERLLALAPRIVAAGGQLAVVDLPIAPWLAADNADYSQHQRLKRPYWRRLQAMQGVSVWDMQTLGHADMFVDGTHPRPKYRQGWGRWLATRLAGLLGP